MKMRIEYAGTRPYGAVEDMLTVRTWDITLVGANEHQAAYTGITGFIAEHLDHPLANPMAALATEACQTSTTDPELERTYQTIDPIDRMCLVAMRWAVDNRVELVSAAFTAGMAEWGATGVIMRTSQVKPWDQLDVLATLVADMQHHGVFADQSRPTRNPTDPRDSHR